MVRKIDFFFYLFQQRTSCFPNNSSGSRHTSLSLLFSFTLKNSKATVKSRGCVCGWVFACVSVGGLQYSHHCHFAATWAFAVDDELLQLPCDPSLCLRTQASSRHKRAAWLPHCTDRFMGLHVNLFLALDWIKLPQFRLLRQLDQKTDRKCLKKQSFTTGKEEETQVKKQTDSYLWWEHSTDTGRRADRLTDGEASC